MSEEFETISPSDVIEDEYHEFLKECVLESMKKNESPTMIVYFFCDRCEFAWSKRVSQILHAAMEVDVGGCPKCHKPDKVKLTHHEPLQAMDGEEDISEFTKVVPL